MNSSSRAIPRPSFCGTRSAIERPGRPNMNSAQSVRPAGAQLSIVDRAEVRFSASSRSAVEGLFRFVGKVQLVSLRRQESAWGTCGTNHVHHDRSPRSRGLHRHAVNASRHPSDDSAERPNRRCIGGRPRGRQHHGDQRGVRNTCQHNIRQNGIISADCRARRLHGRCVRLGLCTNESSARTRDPGKR
jgi:hypothetical protein